MIEVHPVMYQGTLSGLCISKSTFSFSFFPQMQNSFKICIFFFVVFLYSIFKIICLLDKDKSTARVA